MGSFCFQLSRSFSLCNYLDPNLSSKKNISWQSLQINSVLYTTFIILPMTFLLQRNWQE